MAMIVCRAGASFGAGFLYSLVSASGVPNPLSAAFSTGLTFAIFNGLIYQVGIGWQIFDYFFKA
jgi:hypothetical protein